AIRPTVPINILSTQNSWRKVNQYKQGRQDNQDATGHRDDVDIHMASQHEPLVDTPVLQQMFATMTGLSRDVQQLQQSFTTLDLRIQDMQTDIGIVRASASRTQEDVSNLCRSTDRLIGGWTVILE
ncbi:Hypothetical predicted protein, partial [Olea europaea subsp. europaea]